MNITERLLRERNIQAIFDQHNKVRFELYTFGIVFLFGLIMLVAMPARYCAVYWPINLPCLKYAYGHNLRVFMTAIFFTCLIIGGFALAIAVLATFRLPQPGENSEPPRLAYESQHRPANAMIQTAPGQFVLPRGISQAQWRKICALVAKDWYFSRRVTDKLKNNGDGITNEQYTDLLAALRKVGAVIGNDVPEHMRHVFTSPTPGGVNTLSGWSEGYDDLS